MKLKEGGANIQQVCRCLKGERVNYRRYETRSQGIADVIDYIDSFYNLKRRHYRLGISRRMNTNDDYNNVPKSVSGFT